MIRTVFVVLTVLSMTGCASTWAYLKAKLSRDEPVRLIAYQRVDVRDHILPEAVIDFESNSWALNESSYDRLDQIISSHRQYLVEGTAGGLTQAALTLSRKRTRAVIAYLEARGIAPTQISIVNYDPIKPGKQVRVYTITSKQE